MFGHCTDPSVQVHNHTSFPIRPNQPGSLAMPASLGSMQVPLLLSSLLPGTSLFNRETTQALRARPNCHSHQFTSYTLLPSLPSTVPAAVSQRLSTVTGKPDL